METHSDQQVRMTDKIVPPFTPETALAEVKAAKQAWNTPNPEIVVKAYPEDFVAQSERVLQRPGSEQNISQEEVGKGIGLPPDETYFGASRGIGYLFVSNEWHDAGGQ